MQNRASIRFFVLIGSLLIILFLAYNYINPAPFRFNAKRETVILSAVTFLLQPGNKYNKTPDSIIERYQGRARAFIADHPDCCQVWVYYRGVAPNNFLEERSIRNLSDKLDTFLNLETYLVVVKLQTEKNIAWAWVDASARGTIQEFSFRSEEKSQ
ncbi:hypothetical protein [Rhizobium sp. WSM1325]|uniref:hypothetical protein n=1 Tax=Rhizobium sp. WSM1325 TaxID=3444086 RepID=UPI000FF7950E|nr:hypothetical protein [Rhizobium leguminosarum]RWY68277.1 hypothetical protein EHI48_30075 [Rhizobium leguminosarum]